MGGNESDGYYCTICGGVPPDKITTRRVLIDGKETGIDHLDWIFDEVKKLEVSGDSRLAEEILVRVQQFNYVPTKKKNEYAAGLLAAYKESLAKKE
ncbi:NAC family transcription factor [Methanoregula sp.]|uniref:NAC family transcription factor n=1 Tax=Methanoregula sp. TaxID=2052170 RepID=UPI000CC165C0|nr:NAC family transcription factor [Methanoregula sp.]PKG32524.1 MAG: aldolase [Methanoregula sp.]